MGICGASAGQNQVDAFLSQQPTREEAGHGRISQHISLPPTLLSHLDLPKSGPDRLARRPLALPPKRYLLKSLQKPLCINPQVRLLFTTGFNVFLRIFCLNFNFGLAFVELTPITLQFSAEIFLLRLFPLL